MHEVGLQSPARSFPVDPRQLRMSTVLQVCSFFLLCTDILTPKHVCKLLSLSNIVLITKVLTRSAILDARKPGDRKKNETRGTGIDFSKRRDF